MQYTMAPLYVRTVFLILFSIMMLIIITKFSAKSREKIKMFVQVAWVIVSCLVIASTLSSVIDPQVKTVTGAFVQEQPYRIKYNPFRKRCALLCDGKTVYIELDGLTKKAVLLDVDALEKGETYTVVYEERENLILGICKE